MIYFIVAAVILILDQTSKWLIANRMEIGDAHPIIGEFFQITSHRNTGAAFSILEGQRWFFVAVTVVILSGMVWYLRHNMRAGNRLMCWSLGVLLGGALGNFVDRALFGEVVDFLKFRFQFGWFGGDVDYIFPIFNVADSAIVIGVGMIFLDTLIEWRNEKRKKVEESHES